jgi:hypothetical protein
MNNIKLSVSALIFVLLLPFSFACFAENPPTNPNSTKPRDKEMNKPKPMSEEQQDYMLKMHDFSNRILTEKDPAKKEQLKKEQRQMTTMKPDQTSWIDDGVLDDGYSNAGYYSDGCCNDVYKVIEQPIK